MELIKGLNWRYATKKFDSTKKISPENWDKLQEAIRLSASSYGLQLYKVLIIKDDEIRKKLKPAAYNQSQITDADAVIVFCNYTEVGSDEVDSYIKLIAETRGQKQEDLTEFGNYMKNTIAGFDDESKNVWTSKQTYIALGNLLAAASELEIDACPMEGFSASQFNEILDLDAKNLNAAVVATVGYRHEDDRLAKAKKVRKSKSELFEIL